MICNRCGYRGTVPGARFCPSCGNALPVAPPVTGPRCRACGRVLRPGGNFCNGCGARVIEAMPVEPPRPVVPVVPPVPVQPEIVTEFKPVIVPDPPSIPVVEEPIIPELPVIPVVEEPIIPEQPVIPVVEEPIIPESPVVPVVEEPIIPESPVVPTVEEPIIPNPEIEQPVVSKTCMICGNALKADAKFCNDCGAPCAFEPEPIIPVIPMAEPEGKTCPACGKQLRATAKFCNGCGAGLEPVTVTDPAVMKQKKPKKEKTSKKGKKGLLIGIVLGVLALVAAAAVVLFLLLGADKKDEEKAGQAALEWVEAYYSADGEGMLDACHVKVVETLCEKNAVNYDVMAEALQNKLTGSFDFDTASFEVAEVEELDKSDLEDLQEIYEDDYDLELEEACEVTVAVVFAYEDGTEKKDDIEVTVVKVDGKWFCEPNETDLLD